MKGTRQIDNTIGMRSPCGSMKMPLCFETINKDKKQINERRYRSPDNEIETKG